MVLTIPLRRPARPRSVAARALSPLVALYLLCQLTLLPFVLAERRASVPGPVARSAALGVQAPAAASPTVPGPRSR